MKKSEQVSEKTPTANRQYKDTVFRMLFSEKENLPQARQEIASSQYTPYDSIN